MIYLYGFVGPDTRIPNVDARIEDPSHELRVVTHGEVAALVSEVSQVPVDGTRRNLLAHTRVLEAMVAADPVLPLRFGVVVDTEAELTDTILGPLEEKLASMLEEHRDYIELNVKGMYDEDTVLREIVAGNANIRRMRERTKDLPEDATYFDRVKLGEMVAQELQQAKEKDARSVVERLIPLARDHAPGGAQSDRLAVNESFLVERGRADEFDEAVERLRQDLSGRIEFKYVGPLPPYSFVDMSLPVRA